ncbi:hypothetical protein D7X33_39265 [Butyricicoccus sp. 1XD8-22]|nr:hypothetical protein D7X33_39265 [Butyricicoccus sp. 1XD8-22]
MSNWYDYDEKLIGKYNNYFYPDIKNQIIESLENKNKILENKIKSLQEENEKLRSKTYEYKLEKFIEDNKIKVDGLRFLYYENKTFPDKESLYEEVLKELSDYDSIKFIQFSIIENDINHFDKNPDNSITLYFRPYRFFERPNDFNIKMTVISNCCDDLSIDKYKIESINSNNDVLITSEGREEYEDFFEEEYNNEGDM